MKQVGLSINLFNNLNFKHNFNVSQTKQMIDRNDGVIKTHKIGKTLNDVVRNRSPKFGTIVSRPK